MQSSSESVTSPTTPLKTADAARRRPAPAKKAPGGLPAALPPVGENGVPVNDALSLPPLPSTTTTVREWGDRLPAPVRVASTVSATDRELVEVYDSRRAVTLRAYEEFKRDKWGEDRFAEDFEIDDEDLRIGSLGDIVAGLALDSGLAQCVRSYSTAFAALLSPTSSPAPRRRDLSPHSPLLPQTAGESPAPADPQALLAAAATTPAARASASGAAGDLAVPKAVQEVFDFARLSASKVFSAFLGGECPRRAAHDCPRRRRHRRRSVVVAQVM